MRFYWNLVALAGLIGLSPFIWGILQIIASFFFKIHLPDLFIFAGSDGDGVGILTFEIFIYGMGTAFVLAVIGKLIEWGMHRNSATQDRPM